MPALQTLPLRCHHQEQADCLSLNLARQCETSQQQVSMQQLCTSKVAEAEATVARATSKKIARSHHSVLATGIR